MKSKSKTKPSKKAPQSKAPRTTLVAFLLDRSGSMESCKAETISGFNGYLDGLDKKLKMRFTLTQFDSQGIDIIHDGVTLHEVRKLDERSYQPRGSTPLYDAIGRTVRATQDKAKNCNVLFVTLTDGEENASSEWNETTIRALIKEMEDKHHWTFAHIGVGIDGFAATQRYSAGTRSATNVLKSAVGDSKGRFRAMSMATVAYCADMAAAGPQGPIGPKGDIWAGTDSQP